MGLGNLGRYMDENWHGGLIEDVLFDCGNGMVIEDEPSRVRGRVASGDKPASWDWEGVFCRELMRGMTKRQILSKYDGMIARFGLQDEAEEYLERNFGLLGWLVVDVSQFGDKLQYEDIPEYMRMCNIYAINCTSLVEEVHRVLTSGNDGTIDGYLGAEDAVGERISYYDEKTGLKCDEPIDGCDCHEDMEEFQRVADVLLKRGWMTLSENETFKGCGNPVSCLQDYVKRAYAIVSSSDGRFEDDIAEYGLEEQDLEAVSPKSVESVTISDIRELKMDDIGETVLVDSGPDYGDIEEMKMDNIECVRPIAPADVPESSLVSPKMDDIGDISHQERLDIEDEFDGIGEIALDESDGPVEIEESRDPSFSLGDIDVPDCGSTAVDVSSVLPLDEIEVDDDRPADMDDDSLREHGRKEHENDIDLDEFDASSGNVDMNDLFGQGKFKRELEVDEKPEEYEVSDKYDWSW